MKPADRVSKAAGFGMMVAAVLFLASGLGTAEEAEDAAGRDGAGCELRIKGKFIKTLTLVDRLGKVEQIPDPGPSVLLPAGEYRVREVELQGGFRCYVYSERDQDWFTLSPDGPCDLQVGAPLTPKAKVGRQGRLLKLDYELLDAAGRNYSKRDRANPPRFAIYQGDRLLTSGSFEYG